MTGRAAGREDLRLIAGVALASLLSTAIVFALLGRAQGELIDARDRRRATVAALAVAALADRVRATGEPLALGRALSAWQAGNADAVAARVFSLGALRLEASTRPRDSGDRAAPRRLLRDEKGLFDRGADLMSNVDINQDEGAPRKPEIDVQHLPKPAGEAAHGAPDAAAGGRSAVAPVEPHGEVTAAVEIETPAPPLHPGWPFAVVLLTLLSPPLLFLVASQALRGPRSRWAAAVIVLALGVAGSGWFSIQALVQDQVDADVAVAKSLSAQRAHVNAALAAVRILGASGAAALDVSAHEATAWDADRFRRPRGLINDDGDPVLDRIDARLDSVSAAPVPALCATFLLALAVLFIAGSGAATRLGRTLRAHRQAYSYVAPAAIGMLVLVFFPFLYGVLLSFTDSNLYNSGKPLAETVIGLKNYAEILGDFSVVRRGESGSLIINYSSFYWTLLFTIIWTVCNVVIGVSVGLFLALLLNTKGLALRSLYRVLLILPWAMPNYITALIWKGMFHEQFGVINQFIRMCGGQGLAWFDRPLTSFLTALATNGWLSFPFMMVVSLGALQSIPGELYEAARVDGASRWQQLRSITLPQLKPALVPAIILSVVWTFNMFNIIYLVTAGQPGGATEILVTQAYKFAFERYRYGYAAAYSVVIFGILLVYGSWQNHVSRATEAT